MSRKPVSAAQLAANRANARKSTGPKTPRGKVASSRNAIKHGLSARRYILLPDDPAGAESDLRAVLECLVARYQPHGRTEVFLLQRIAVCCWHLARASRLNPQSHPDSATPNLKSEIQNLQSAPACTIPNLQFEISNLQSAPACTIPNLQFEISNLQSAPVTPNQQSRISRYETRIRSQLRNTLTRLLRIQAERQVADPASLPASENAPSAPRLHEPIATVKTAFLTPPGPMENAQM